MIFYAPVETLGSGRKNLRADENSVHFYNISAS